MDMDGDGISRPEDCDDTDPDVGVISWWVDADGDGFGSELTVLSCSAEAGMVSNADDCDDSDPSAFPGADEVCDGTDDDCDTEIDEDSAVDAEIWYADADGDGYGDPHSTQRACDVPSGYIADQSDCDDADPERHPGARDICDGVDGDCNGVIDDLYWWEDADGDGYGSPYSIELDCDQPDGHVDNDADCDDEDAAISPAAGEVCDDANIDEDCDGLIDDADDDAIGQTPWYQDSDGDGYGDSATKVLSCDAPAEHVSEGGDCDDGNAMFSPGVAEIWYDGADQDCAGGDDYDADGDGYLGDDCDDQEALVNPGMTEACGDDIDNDCDGVSAGACLLEGEFSLSDADVVFPGSGTQQLGETLAGAGDLNGDGVDDVLIGDPVITTPGSGGGYDGGVAYIALGPTSGTITFSMYAHTYTMQAALYGIADNYVGSGLDGVGDTNGDGYADLVVSATGNGGTAALVTGPVSAGSDLLYDVAEATLSGAGAVVSGAGDVNGDSFDDFLLSGGDSAAYLITGPLTTSGALTELALVIEVGGSSMSGRGDLDGDGFVDVVVGAPSVDSTGGAYVFLGPLSSDRTSADAYISGDYVESNTGAAVDHVGDINGDGLADLVIGAPYFDKYSDVRASHWSAGAVYVLHGPLTGEVSVTSAVARYDGEDQWTLAGTSVSSSGDINGDGRDDVLVGAPGTLSFATPGAYVLYGPISGIDLLSSADVRIYGTDATKSTSGSGDLAGTAVDILGDADGDGFDDILVGAPWASDASGYTSGAAYQFYGGNY